MYDNLILEVRDRVAVLTVNRPRTLNALDRQTLTELEQAFDAVSCDDGVGAAVITGAGGRAFVAGADIRELATLRAAEGEAYSRAGQAVFDAIERSPKPVIAAVNGYALGGGCELAMACAIRVASRDAMFGQPEVQLGLIPGFGGTQRLPRIVGKGRALQLLLTGLSIDAEEAYRIGLVNAVVDAERLMPMAETMARTIARHGPDAVARVLEAVRRGLDEPLAGGQAIESGLFGASCGTPEMRERTRAFLDGNRK